MRRKSRSPSIARSARSASRNAWALMRVWSAALKPSMYPLASWQVVHGTFYFGDAQVKLPWL